MPTITFYRQARRDGGIRTGIEIDDNAVLARFEEGHDDSDPALVWYVDVRCRGSALPKTAAAARAWLIRRGVVIARLLNSMADDIPAGIDPAESPMRKDIKLSSGLHISVVCTAVRRLEASRLCEILRDIASRWAERVNALPEIEA